MTSTLRHPLLGSILGKTVTGELTQYSGLPYASIAHRFSRSTTLSSLPSKSAQTSFDATGPGPESVQPLNATESDATGNQFPHDGFEEAPQAEDCLSLNITTPTSSSDSSLPVLVFLHGGAFFLGSSSRPYYSPLNLLTRAVHTHHPLVFVSINYRLSTLGFAHQSDIPDTLPPNNAMHDQLRAFDWIHRNIAGFGGDPGRITAIGQSAGSMSLSLHSISGRPTALFRQMICFSGSPVTMPTKTPGEYDETFLDLAKKLEIKDVEKKSASELAKEFVQAPVGKIRDLSFVGKPCTSSGLLPYDHTSMAMTRRKPETGVTWIERAIYSSATYDGGVSYNILAPFKKDNARTFIDHVHGKMSEEGAAKLLDLYQITTEDSDPSALEKICQFESDIGFFHASLAQVEGSSAKHRYLQVFDLENPFDAGGSLPKDRFATHTWDIVALLGCYDELLTPETLEVVQGWRDRMLRFVCEGDEPWDQWDEGDGKALRVSKAGTTVESKKEYMGEDGARRRKVMEIAMREGGDTGADYLWEGVCRTWLDG